MPFRSQYDGSPYQNSNCGPAALAMVLQAYGIDVSIGQIRARANEIQGTSSYDDGVALDYLQSIGQETGLRTEGLTTGDGHYRAWSMADVIREVRSGYPVITLVHYATLPDHATSQSSSDHYIVVIGVTRDGFVVNDPAFTSDGGLHRVLRPDQLIAAWRDAGIHDQAVAFLPPLGKPDLALLDQASNRSASLLQNQSAGSNAPPPVVAYPPPSRSSGGTTVADPAATPGPAVPAPAKAKLPTGLVNLGRWQHNAMESQSDLLGPPIASPGRPPATVVTPTVATALSATPAPFDPTPVLAVVILIVTGALAILRLPGPDGR